MRILLLLVVAGLIHAQEYDLLLKGGHVIDPKNKINGRRDVAIKDGRIAAVAAEIPATKAAKTVNVAGLYVTPGLVDLHVHVFAGTGTAYTGPSSVRPDDHSFRSGVTTMVDAGSSGWRNFEEFKKLIIDQARTRVLAMLNIVGAGMAGDAEQNLQDMDPDKAAAMAAKHKDIIVGFKSAHYAGPEWTSVENAVKAGGIAGLPVMVDFGQFRPERPFEDLVTKKLRPGDIYTHMFLAIGAHAGRSGPAAPLSSGGSQAWSSFRRWAWRRQFSVPPGCTCHPTGIPARLHFDRPAHRKHEWRHDDNADHVVQIHQHGNDA